MSVLQTKTLQYASILTNSKCFDNLTSYKLHVMSVLQTKTLQYASILTNSKCFVCELT